MLRSAVFVAALIFAAPAMSGSSAPVWFQAIDQNGDGVITLDEMHGARYHRFAFADADKDGWLTKTELKRDYVWSQHFAAFDADDDGRISIEEYEARGQSRFVSLDADGDGRLTLKEALLVINAARNANANPQG